MKSKNLLTLLFLPFLIFCLNPTNDTQYTNFELGTPFILNYKQAVRNEEEEILIKFNSVLSDSRCPTGVECVWAGKAELQFIAIKANDSIKFNLISSGQHFGQDTTIFNLHIKLLEVIPYPDASINITIEDYKAKIIVDKVVE